MINFLTYSGFSIERIAKIAGVQVDFAKHIQQ